MPDPCSTPTRHRTAIRVALGGVGLIQVFNGLYALFAPTLVLQRLPARAAAGSRRCRPTASTSSATSAGSSWPPAPSCSPPPGPCSAGW